MRKIKTDYGDMWVKPGDHISDILIEHGAYEQAYINIFLASVANDQATVLDIGANIGVFTIAFALNFKHVLAYEPGEEARGYLYKNIDDYNNVTVFHTALGHYNGTACLAEDGGSNMGGRALKMEGDVINIMPLDESVGEYDAMKIDVEGGERMVIFGARESIKRNRPVIMYENVGHENCENKLGAMGEELRNFNILEFLIFECEYSKVYRFKKNVIAIP